MAKYEIYDEVRKLIFYRQICNYVLAKRHERHATMLINRLPFDHLTNLVYETRKAWADIYKISLLYCFQKSNVDDLIPLCFFSCFVENKYQFIA